MPSAPDPPTPVPGRATGKATRRERLRAQTYDDIVATARAALAAGQPIALRAVAAELGMAPSALYRYIDSHDDLQRLVMTAICADFVTTMTEVEARYPDDALLAGGASVIAFRRWALDHPAEFQLVFTPMTSKALGGYTSEDLTSAPLLTEFVMHHQRLQLMMVAQYGITFPPVAELSPRAREGMARQSALWEGTDIFPTLDPAYWWWSHRQWARILGLITMEVYGQVPPGLVATDAMFEDLMHRLLDDLGLDEATRARAAAAMEAELARGV